MSNPTPVNYSSLIGATGLTGFSNIGDIITKLVPYFFLAAGVLLLLYLLWGGLSLMLSQGDPKAIEGGKGKITSALIGFIIIFVAYWLVQIVANLLGLQNILNIFK